MTETSFRSPLLLCLVFIHTARWWLSEVPRCTTSVCWCGHLTCSGTWTKLTSHSLSVSSQSQFNHLPHGLHVKVEARETVATLLLQSSNTFHKTQEGKESRLYLPIFLPCVPASFPVSQGSFLFISFLFREFPNGHSLGRIFGKRSPLRLQDTSSPTAS